MGNNNCIILVNYFAVELITNILDISLKYNLDLVIVDNSCSEKEKDELDQLISGLSYVNVIYSHENVGFGKGCNMGVEYAKNHNNYNAYLFINPDITEINLSHLNDSLEEFLSLPQYAYFQPIIVDDREEKSILGLKKTNTLSLVLLYTFLKYFFKFLHHNVLKVEDVTIENNNIYIPSGAFFIVKAEVLEKIGGFPIDNFLYFEEWLFADRVNKLNLMGYVDTNLKVHHQIGYSTGLQYGAGSEKMLKYRKDAFLKAIMLIEHNTFLKILEYMIILLDFTIRVLIVKLKRFKHDYM